MNLIDRHILREWLKIFALVLGATFGLLLMQELYDRFRDLMELQASPGDVATYFLLSSPTFLPVVLPLALMVSLLYALGQLHRNNEITALRAAGVGLFTLTRSLWLAGAVLCALTWWLSATVIPRSVEASNALLERLQFERDATLLSADRAGAVTGVAFDNRRARRVWFMNRYSPFLGKGFGVSVTELDEQRRDRTQILAREAWLDPERGYWVFRAGVESWFDSESGQLIRSAVFQEKSFPHLREDPSLMLVFDRKPGDLSFVELRRILDYYVEIAANPKISLYATRYYALLADTLGPLIILTLAIPFAVSGVRVNPAVGVSKSLGLFVIYFLLVKASYALGGRDVLPPIFAALLPNIAMLGLGMVFMVRAR